MANFDSYMAESGQQSTLDSLRKNFQYDSAKSQYESQGWYGVSPQQKAQQQSTDAANAQLAREQQLTQQAIGTLESQKPVIGQIYGQKRDVLQSNIDPTKARYDALIADIKGQQQTTEEQQTKATNAEMARRGIMGGYADQERLNALQPIQRSYSGLIQQTGLAGEQDIKAIQDAIKLLYGEEAASNMSLAGLISQAQMGGGQNALSAANTLFGNAQSQAALAQQQAEAQSQQKYQDAVLAMQQQLQPYNVTAADLQNQAAQLALKKAQQVGTGSPSAGTDYESLWQAYNRGIAGGQGINSKTGLVQITG